ncbi:MAG: CheY-like chemotaxis protein [Mariniblastus sp.]|jgi:CheY-like chemotaxis protein
MIVFLTSDLMMTSHASSFARQREIKFKTSVDADAAIKLIELRRPYLFLVDLQTPGLDIPKLGEMIRDLADSVCPLTVAYAQHVNVEVLQQGKTAGFDQVMTRGQFNSQIGQIIANVS